MITFNGVQSNSIGVIVERIPNRSIPARRFTRNPIPGRNGDVLTVDKTFPNDVQEYEVYYSGAVSGLHSVAHAAAAWLTAPVDYAVLWDDYDPDVYREAIIESGVDIENTLNKFGRSRIVFCCKPQKFLTSGTTPVTPENGTITNPTIYDARPLLKVSGSGTITINGYSIEVLEAVTDFLIDCETMEADDNLKISCTEFPVLSGGENSIEVDDTITAIEITPRWWKL